MSSRLCCLGFGGVSAFTEMMGLLSAPESSVEMQFCERAGPVVQVVLMANEVVDRSLPTPDESWVGDNQSLWSE